MCVLFGYVATNFSQDYSLSDCYQNMGAFSRLDDSVLWNTIGNSQITNPEMIRAQELLSRMDSRKHYRLVVFAQSYSDEQENRQVTERDATFGSERICLTTRFHCRAQGFAVILRDRWLRMGNLMTLVESPKTKSLSTYAEARPILEMPEEHY